MTTLSYDQYAQHMASLPRKMQRAVKMSLYSSALQGVALVRESARQKGVLDQGHYIRAWQAGKTQLGAELFNTEPYSDVIELGRRPGSFPPVDPLVGWVERNLSIGPGESVEQVAFLVARAIYRRGLPARHVLTDIVPKLAKIATDAVAQAMADVS